MGATSLAVREAQASRDTSWEPMLRLLIEQERAGQPLAADIAASLLKRRPCKEHERLLALALGQRGTLILPDHPRRPRATGARPSCKARGVILEGHRVGPRKARHEGDGYRRNYLALVAPGVAVRFVSRWIRDPGTIAYVQGYLQAPTKQLDLLPGSVFHVFEPFGRDLLAVRLDSARSLLGCGLPDSMNCRDCDGWGTVREGEASRRTCMACGGRGRNPRSFASQDEHGNWIPPKGSP